MCSTESILNPIDSMTSSQSIKLSHHWSKLLSSDPNPLWVPTVMCITSSPVPVVSIYHSSTTKSNMLYLARCRSPHKKNNTNKPQKKTQTKQANKQSWSIWLDSTSTMLSFLFSKHMIHGKQEVHTRAPLPVCGKLFAPTTATSKRNPSLTPKNKERNLHTTQKQTQNVIASSKSYQKWNDELNKFNKRETEKER